MTLIYRSALNRSLTPNEVDENFRHIKQLTIRDYGGVGDGATDDTAAFQAAADAGLGVLVPPGRYRLTGPIIVSKPMSFIGVGGLRSTVVILCNEIDGYTFEISETISNFRLECMTFDGREQSAYRESTDESGWSVNWGGLLRRNNPLSSGNSAYGVRIHDVHVAWSTATSAAIDLRSMFDVLIDQSRIGYWGYGIGIEIGVGYNVSTTITISKTYIHYCRQCFKSWINSIAIHFDDCIFESSVVVGTGFATAILFTKGHAENIGYDITQTGITTGLEDKDLIGIYGEGILDTPIIAGFTFMKSSVIFDQFAFTYKAPQHISAHPNANWIALVGRTGADQPYRGGLIINGTTWRFIEGTPLFEVDIDLQAEKWDIVINDNTHDKVYIIADVRLISHGRVSVAFGEDDNRLCEINRGLIKLAQDSGGLDYSVPSGGEWVVGDIIVYNDPTPSGAIGVICTTGGDPGTWKEFGAISA